MSFTQRTSAQDNAQVVQTAHPFPLAASLLQRSLACREVSSFIPQREDGVRLRA